MSVEAAVNSITSGTGDASTRMNDMVSLVNDYFNKKDYNALMTVVDILLSSDPQYSLFSRPMLNEISKTLQQSLPVTLSSGHIHDIKSFTKHILSSLMGRVVAYEEEDAILRESLAQIFVYEDDYQSAARTLSQIDVEGSVRFRSVEDKAQLCVKIAEYYLEVDESSSAELYCNKAGSIIHEVKDVNVVLRFKVTYARILDSKRQFTNAAQRYYELSCNREQVSVDPTDLERLLRDAATCTLLSPAGPQRCKMLALLMKDDRVSSLDFFDLLHSVFHSRFVSHVEVSRFEGSLKEHQRATDAHGMTVLQKAILQHNVLASSCVYKNMKFSSFGEILGVSAENAEAIAAKMISEKRMDAYLDQQTETIHFSADDDSYELRESDERIGSLCDTTNNLAARALIWMES
eukprot:GHVR01139445.1.p1 GENE.GHVR01139445.1~~GHVR01139445.1.p1  ORF type:complete len:405 (-),score=99.07 GHVR01139445.1:82-1296(-)